MFNFENEINENLMRGEYGELNYKKYNKNAIIEKAVDFNKSLAYDLITRNYDYVRDLLKIQKDDGSISMLTDYHADRDIRVEFIYRPTFISLLILMNSYIEKKDELVKEAIIKGLNYCCEVSLSGHGDEIFSVLIANINLFMNNGLFEFNSKYPELTFKFVRKLNKIREELFSDDNDFIVSTALYKISLLK